MIISALGISIQGIGGTLQASQGIDPVDTTVLAAKAVAGWLMIDPTTAVCNLPAAMGLPTASSMCFGTVETLWG